MIKCWNGDWLADVSIRMSWNAGGKFAYLATSVERSEPFVEGLYFLLRDCSKADQDLNSEESPSC